jgi:diaminohydroxyphosphoribosylaminopyrimidine deaminase/5-amino-6-(5-phosphoribosylamino)uracil reductase
MSAPRDRFHKLLDAGAEILIARSAKGRVDLKPLMGMLATFDITSVLIEGGAEVNAAALKAGIVDKIVLFIAPTLMTGVDSLCSVGGISPIKLSHALRLRDVTARFVGQDLMVEGYIK